jgi:hypothetical protein
MTNPYAGKHRLQNAVLQIRTPAAERADGPAMTDLTPMAAPPAPLEEALERIWPSATGTCVQGP